MTNIEKLARDLYAMKHRDRIIKALPSILEISIQHGSNREDKTPILVGDISIIANKTERFEHAG